MGKFEDLTKAQRAKLASIVRQHKIAPVARKAISEWADEYARAAFDAGADSMLKAFQQVHIDWKERRERLTAVGIYPSVKVLRVGMNAVEGGASGRLWNDAKSDELTSAAVAIVTGTDEAKKAKLIAACKSVP